MDVSEAETGTMRLKLETVVAKVSRAIVEWYPYAKDNDILVLIDSCEEDIYITTDLKRIRGSSPTRLVL